MTTTIVGRGPSLLALTAADFPAGPVIALNAAIVQIRRLGLPNPIYTMQKDGCNHQDWRGDPNPEPCAGCPAGDMIMPQQPETLIVSAAESQHCFADYAPRIVVDVEAFGLPWYTMSAPTAVKIAAGWGETDLLMLGHDAYTRNDVHVVEPNDVLTDNPHGGYRNAGVQAAEFVAAAGMTVTWR